MTTNETYEVVDQRRYRALVLTGAICGITATLIYLVWSFLPLLPMLNLFFHFAFGPLVIVGTLGVAAFLERAGSILAAPLAKVFGVVAGAFFTGMRVVQSSNLSYINRFIREAESQATKDDFGRAFDTVFTVQLGLDVCWDLFISLATILFGVALLRVNNLARVLGLFGILAGAALLVLNLYTFPVPPREAGLFDIGPAVGLWFLLVSAWLLFRQAVRRRDFPEHERRTAGAA